MRKSWLEEKDPGAILLVSQQWVSQVREIRERKILQDITDTWNLKKAKLIETESKMVVSRGLGVEKMGRC